MDNFRRNNYNGEWHIDEREEFFALKYFQSKEEVTKYINNNKEIKNNNYNIISNREISLEISLEDYLNLPKKLKNK